MGITEADSVLFADLLLQLGQMPKANVSDPVFSTE
jgi:hypothetical protein